MRDGLDVLDDLDRAGVVLRIDGGRIVWRCDPARPPVPGRLFLKLAERKAEIVRILLNVPHDCPQPAICSRIGVCPREIESSACTYADPPCSVATPCRGP